MAQWRSVNREHDEETKSVGTRHQQHPPTSAAAFIIEEATAAEIIVWGSSRGNPRLLLHVFFFLLWPPSLTLPQLRASIQRNSVPCYRVAPFRVLGLCDLFAQPGMSSSDETLVRWGLHLLEVVGGAIDQNNQANNQATSSNRLNSQPLAPAHSTTENDEAIARTLQEQLYSAGSVDDTGDCDCDCAAIQPAPEVGDFFDRKDGHEHVLNDYGLVTSDASAAGAAPAMGGGEMGNSCSTSGDQNESDEAIAVVLSEELAQLDGEVGRRLTHMESIPHIPKINGEIPSADDASADHQRLIDRLQVYGLTEHKIPGDGNCQFRALSDQFYRTPDHHMFVRKEVVKQLKHDPEPYEGYVPMKYNEYLKKMAKNGEWGDHVTLQAAADTYGIKICLITSFKDTCIVEIVPKEVKSDRVIFLSFWAEVHYNSVYPQGEVPISYHVKKKRHWFSFFG